MKVQNIVNILKAEILAEGDLQEEVKTACGSDMMSDVLAFVKDQSVLLTGNDGYALHHLCARQAPG